jgi:glutamate racemase
MRRKKIPQIIRFFLLLLVIPFFISGCQTRNKTSYKIEESILNDTSCFFYLDTENYPANRDNLPIGIFDSGTGGLTVLNAILNYDNHNNQNYQQDSGGDGLRDFEQESFIYLGDKANMPYGNYASEGKIDLLKEHIFKDVQFLLGTKYYKKAADKNCQSDKQPVKAIVIACNTATAYGKTDIESFLKKARLEMEVIGVISAGVKGAVNVLGHDEKACIGVLATEGTVASNGYADEFKRQLENNDFSHDIQIYQQAGIGLAGAVDGIPDYIDAEAESVRQDYKGPSLRNEKTPIHAEIIDRYQFDWTENKILYSGDKNAPEAVQLNSIENYISYHLVTLLEKIKKSQNPQPLKAVILGCTHYPFFEDTFAEKLNQLYHYQENDNYVYRDILNSNVTLIDPAENTAQELYEYLRSNQLFSSPPAGKSRFYVSVPNIHNPAVILDSTGAFTYEYKYGRAAGVIQEYVKRVPFSSNTIQPQVIERIREKMPLLYLQIPGFEKIPH